MAANADQHAVISIIIPVYNSEKTLERTIDSILSQSYPALEIIMVDDGSRDGSLALCRTFAQKDPRIKVLSRENGGCAAARNTALDAMTGEYVMFVDSDDTLEGNACQTMLHAIGKNNLAIAHYYFDVGRLSAEKGLLNENGTIAEEAFFLALMKRPGAFYYSALWNKLYRADIIRKYGLRFDPFFNWGEDFAFNMQYYRYVRDVSLIDTPIYHYQKNAASTSTRTLLHVIHSCAIKYRLYRLFRGLYTARGLYRNHRWLINRYIFNVTWTD